MLESDESIVVAEIGSPSKKHSSIALSIILIVVSVMLYFAIYPKVYVANAFENCSLKQGHMTTVVRIIELENGENVCYILSDSQKKEE